MRILLRRPRSIRIVYPVKKIQHLSTETQARQNGLSYYHNSDPVPLVYRTVGEQLEVISQKYPNRVAIASMHENLAITFPETLEKADKLAAGLAGLGIEKGDRVGIWMPNKTSWYISMMAVARLGGISVALNPAYQVPEIEYCIKKVGIKAMITTETFKTQNYYKMLAEIIPELNSGNTKLQAQNYSMERVIIDSDQPPSGTLSLNELLRSSETDVAEIQTLHRKIQPDDGCNIQFTSGTTGKPKAALLSHYNFVNNGYHIGGRFEFDKAHHKVCMPTPLFHAYGVVIGVMAGLAHAASLYLPGLGFNAANSIKCIQKYGCTYLYGTPTMHVDTVAQLIKSKEQLKTLKYATTGGSPVSPQLSLDMQEYLGVERVRSVFGMTETSAVLFQSTPTEDKERVLNYVGKLTKQLEAKVVDSEGNLVPSGSPGELWVRGYSTMLGYYGDEEKTREMIGRDKWLKTGDQFVLYEDGYGKIVGRLKEMIIRGGENIFPKEIEDFLATHPDILEVHVAGVPDDRMGEEVAAFIKLKPGISKLTREDIKSFSKGKIAHFKIPRYVEVVTEYPKTTSGKIQKFKLVQTFVGNQK